MSEKSNPAQLSSKTSLLYTLTPSLRAWRQSVAQNPAFIAFYGTAAFLFRLCLLIGLNEAFQLFGKLVWNQMLSRRIELTHPIVAWIGNTSVSLIALSLIFLVLYAIRSFMSQQQEYKDSYQTKQQIKTLRQWRNAVLFTLVGASFMCAVIFWAMGDSSTLTSGEIYQNYTTLEYAFPVSY